MKIVKPKSLKPGDTIGVISPASTPSDVVRINKGILYLEELGYKVEAGKHLGKHYGYLAGTDEERLEDMHNMFANPDVKAIFCVRGGYGTPRLLSKIDYKLIKQNPKIFVGYSDITALQMAFLTRANLVTFAGPMLAVDFHSDVNKYAEELFWRTLTSEKPIGDIPMPEGQEIKVRNNGKAEGALIGGNLAVFVSLAGSRFMPKSNGGIMMLEEVGEAPYRVDRLLNQLEIMEYFDKLKGIILGQFTNCVDEPDARTLELVEVFNRYFGDLDIPIISNFPHGHVDATCTMPFGIDVKINTSKNSITITEGAVTA